MSDGAKLSGECGEALLRDPDFVRLFDEDLAAERRGDVDPGLSREEFLAKYKDVLTSPDG